ncbi:MAG: hypothetical protein Q9164_004948 [Protoblastenia rupestris]
MNGASLCDHTPDNSDAVPPISGAANLVLIDNYDSFTWNVYAILVLEGANVTVYRNDEVTLQDLISIKPTQLVVSPGPGNPEEDAGISKDAIRYFAGKIPVLGVCMGEQCVFTVFGGKVEITGEILHGKTSPLRHDSKGLFAGLEQEIAVTRYHSLAGTHSSLPDCLEVSAWIASGLDRGKGIIMGIRHKQLVVEGVQFHPESILTAKGRLMLGNFLRMRGGTWKENQHHQQIPSQNSKTVDIIPDGNSPVNGMSKTLLMSKTKPSILDEIFGKRRVAVEHQKRIPSFRPSDLQASYDLNLAPPQISFSERLRQSPFTLSLMAEVKRASPSKGDIAPHICAPAQAKKYAIAGASVISVLTEPEYFKGSLNDMQAVRQILAGMPHRPAVLRKEFIFDEYQILEARLAGADTVLLIVKMLSQVLLKRLYLYSQSLGMEPLVEVNTVEEMKIALELGSKIIGVNNRDLASFEVDLDTTSRLMEGVPDDTIVCALSGISSSQDVEAYRKNKVSAVLVGEALMKAVDIDAFVNSLVGGSSLTKQSPRRAQISVKICGTRTAEAARVAIAAGADMIGIILVEGRTRSVAYDTALEISNVVHTTRKGGQHRGASGDVVQDSTNSDFFGHSARFLSRGDRALLVGVFRNQPLSYLLDQRRLLNLDIVQLHGSEPIEWASLIPVPVIRRFGLSDQGLGLRGYHALPLLDSALGGTGQSLDIGEVQAALSMDENLRVVLAGGLTPSNVRSILNKFETCSRQIIAVDVSSGVEENGAQDHKKIVDFVSAVKQQF